MGGCGGDGDHGDGLCCQNSVWNKMSVYICCIPVKVHANLVDCQELKRVQVVDRYLTQALEPPAPCRIRDGMA